MPRFQKAAFLFFALVLVMIQAVTGFARAGAQAPVDAQTVAQVV